MRLQGFRTTLASGTCFGNRKTRQGVHALAGIPHSEKPVYEELRTRSRTKKRRLEIAAAFARNRIALQKFVVSDWQSYLPFSFVNYVERSFRGSPEVSETS